METRSNNVFVGAVVLLLMALTVGAAFWFSRIGESDRKEYDIFFKQSVSGIARGSAVTYAGVPSGQVQSIELWERDPQFVRVRIVVSRTTPVLQGTTATINGVGFTGVSEIQLEGAVRGAPPIVCPERNTQAVCPEGVPVIPTKPGALGELLNSAPMLLERLTTLTERLTELLDDRNQKHIAGILQNLDKLTGDIAARGPELADTITQAKLTLENASKAAESLAQAANNTNALVNEEGRPLIRDLRTTIRNAGATLETLDATLKEAQPGMRTFTRDTMPQIGLLVRDLRQVSRSLQAVTDTVEQQGAGALIGSPKLPDYKP
ncbi:phospholipid/cholesterol/gamma-HCH transport system substrate-binding protein [Sphingobium sp. B2D3A]|uniref:MlaD family protein n=1 Tax=unclassified Sphingobium TaxID=2611147 RepID=UPI0022252EF8|nr:MULTISPECIES: MlaD family protein [unclassified Sphingobium]MCW2336414.1 phospholipid/cholesterol/gamma-HCH transport system substrate-binding protein [Sphingobium sp. B2D3A]MCW2383270.1 phospholipid/cholesterol/gamma-HCH transport system substrate-binding protein [Sphingobium sp. B2D3B]MCW2386168.1 phospholipid/cholesterol/gamma-HCH transport system substrate-binding protein [Sphingobium sp. B2D3D]MCW2399755.1 phospholipid/cholesterol/gamma-HCH transport system substrate-binding protein [Sp